MLKKKCILFTSIGRRVELVQLFRNAAKELQEELIIYGADYRLDAPALVYCDEKIQTCRIQDKQYIPQLLTLCREKNVDLLIPTIDTDLLLLAENKEAFETAGTKVLISEADKIKICRDKRYTSEFFESCSCKSPKPVDQAALYKDGFPCFIKPRDGSSSINAFRVNTEKELLQYANTVPEYIIQPFIDGAEYTVDVFCDFKGNPIYITPRERVAIRSGEVLKTKIFQDEKIIQECIRIVKGFKPCGPITVQLIREKSTGKNYYIEINPRFGGGAPCSIMAGADAAKATLQLLDGEKSGYINKAARDKEVYSRFDQSICVNSKNSGIIQIQSLEKVQELVEDIEVVIFDLDDTLYSEKEYVKSGFKELAKCLPGVDNAYEKLYGYFLEKKIAVDELLNEENIFTEELKKKCLKVYREHIPQLYLSAVAESLLDRLKGSGKKIGILTDGRVNGQKNKIKSLGLEKFADEILITDELAGNSSPVNFRKPNEIGFQILKERFQTPFCKMAYIGDNLSKDFKAPQRLGMKSIWYRNVEGLYYTNIENLE